LVIEAIGEYLLGPIMQTLTERLLALVKQGILEAVETRTVPGPPPNSRIFHYINCEVNADILLLSGEAILRRSREIVAAVAEVIAGTRSIEELADAAVVQIVNNDHARNGADWPIRIYRVVITARNLHETKSWSSSIVRELTESEFSMLDEVTQLFERKELES
jgi:hypothetical protein